MIPGLKPYPAYRDSGVEWLGEVPERWEARKLRHVLRQVTVRNRPDLPLLSVVREKGVVLRDVSNGDENRNFIPDDLSNYKVVRSGQFAMNKMKAWQGSYGVSRHDGIVSPAYFIFDIAGVGGDYFHAAMRSKAYVPFFTQASDGVRIGQWDLSQARMREVPFFVPPLPEQSAIVHFLDHVDRRIRRYIRAKQKLIALLHERRQAIIHRIVTRGLDPDVRLKPSGVEWLGDVPEHWAVTSVRRLVSLITSGSRGWAKFYNDEGDLFIQSGNLGRSMALDLQRVQRVRVPRGAEGQRTKVARGDVLLCITGALTGNVAFVSEDLPKAYVNQHIALLRPDAPAIVPRFLAYALHSPYAQAQFKSTEYGGTKQGLGLGEVRDTFVLVPSREEQRDIVARLDLQCGHIMDSTDQVRREISLLREYRTRLISDVVTGKLDVREAAAHLPEETGEPEPLDDTDTSPEDISEETEAPDPDALEEAEA